MTDTELLSVFDGMYSGDKDGSGVRCYSFKVVRPRLPKECPGNFSGALHYVPAAKRGITERAIVDGAWRHCYTCEDCIIAWAKERGLIEIAPSSSVEREVKP